MKVAFLTGRAVEVDHTFSKMKKHVFDKVDCDIHMHTDSLSRDTLLAKIDKYGIKPKSIIITEDQEVNNTAPIMEVIRGRESVDTGKIKNFWGRYMQQLYYIYGAFNFVFQWYPRYDWYVRCRFDMVFKNDIDDFSKLDKDCLYIPLLPDNEWYFNDRFGFGGYEVMKVYANRWELAHEIEQIDGFPEVECPEMELACVMNNMKIERRWSACKPIRYGKPT